MGLLSTYLAPPVQYFNNDTISITSNNITSTFVRSCLAVEGAKHETVLENIADTRLVTSLSTHYILALNSAVPIRGMWTLQFHFLPPSPWEQRQCYPLHRGWAGPRALLDDVESSCSRSICSLSRYWQSRSLHKFDLLTVMPVLEVCTAPKGSSISEN